MIAKYKRFNSLCMDTDYRGMIGLIFGLSTHPQNWSLVGNDKMMGGLRYLKNVQNVGQQAGF